MQDCSGQLLAPLILAAFDSCKAENIMIQDVTPCSLLVLLCDPLFCCSVLVLRARCDPLFCAESVAQPLAKVLRRHAAALSPIKPQPNIHAVVGSGTEEIKATV